MQNKKYRPNVAIFVLNRRGEILTCERNDYPGTWQIPQGGIEAGENSKEAAIRELYEEIGTRSLKFLAKVPGKFRYDWPKKLRSKRLGRKGFHGQEQIFFIFQISPWAKINLSRAAKKDRGIKQEFQEFEFLNPKEFIKRVNSFKKETYQKALTKAISKFPELFEEATVGK